MSNTYEICDVTVTLPALGSMFQDAVGNEGKRGEKCRVNLYAVNPERREKGSTFEGFMVGRTTFEGYTESPYIRTLRIMRPHGYKLVALRVDDRDQPESWDSLPVHFVGGYIDSPVLDLEEIADLPRFKIGSDFVIQQKIADALHIAKTRFYETFGNTNPEKTPVLFLANRWVAIEGSYTPEEISAAVEHIQAIRSGEEFSKAASDAPPFVLGENGKVFIKEAMISDADTTANSLMKLKRDENGCLCAAGMGIAVEDGDKKVRFLADKFEVNKSGTLHLKDAIATAAESKTRLSDEMRDAVIDAIRESDVFKALLSSQDAQASALVTMQQAIEQAATDVIRNALKPGGLLFGKH